MQQAIEASHFREDETGPRRVNWREFFKAIMKSGILFARNIQGMGQGMYSEAQKLVAEAKDELDRDKRAKAASSNVGEPE